MSSYVSFDILTDPDIYKLEARTGSEGVIAFLRILRWAVAHSRYLCFETPEEIARCIIRDGDSSNDSDASLVRAMIEQGLLSMYQDGYMVNFNAAKYVPSLASKSLSSSGPAHVVVGVDKELEQDVATVVNSYMAIFPETNGGVWFGNHLSPGQKLVREHLKSGYTVAHLIEATEGHKVHQFYIDHNYIGPKHTFGNASVVDRHIQEGKSPVKKVAKPNEISTTFGEGRST